MCLCAQIDSAFPHLRISKKIQLADAPAGQSEHKVEKDTRNQAHKVVALLHLHWKVCGDE